MKIFHFGPNIAQGGRDSLVFETELTRWLVSSLVALGGSGFFWACGLWRVWWGVLQIQVGFRSGSGGCESFPGRVAGRVDRPGIFDGSGIGWDYINCTERRAGHGSGQDTTPIFNVTSTSDDFKKRTSQLKQLESSEKTDMVSSED